jgi:hypothetical protein
MPDEHRQYPREEIRCPLSSVRQLLVSYSGLYASGDIACDVFRACDEPGKPAQSSLQFKKVRHIVQESCTKLARDADRFSMRYPTKIAISRARAIASIDRLQGVILELRKAEQRVPHLRSFLRQRSL